MIDLRICGKCRHCGDVSRGESDDDGSRVSCPQVQCGLGDCILMLSDEPPEECPYVAEHLLAMDGCPQDVVDSLSGKLRDDDDEPLEELV